MVEVLASFRPSRRPRGLPFNWAGIRLPPEMVTMIDARHDVSQAKILLVDDDEAVRTSLKTVLEFSLFRVTAAATVPEALQLIAKEPFDVLLCDLHMPGAGDGFTVVSAM